MAHKRLTVQVALTVPPVRVVVNERAYVTAPAVLLVAGVLNHGLVASEELKAEAWNHVPVVVGHPMDAEGLPISAREPSILAHYGVGSVYRARLQPGQRQGHPVTALAAELWIDVQQAETLGGEALQAMQMIESQTPMDVSTAFYSTAEQTRGSFYGVSYQEIHHDLIPDHLALLPNAIGACNWADDGCGVPRLHHQCSCHEETTMDHTPARGWRGFVQTLKTFVHGAEAALITEQTDIDLRTALYGAFAREMGQDVTPIFILDVDQATQTFRYRRGERLLQRTWITDASGLLTLGPEEQDVQPDTTYHVVTQAQHPHQQEDSPMATEAVQTRVTALITNTATPWQEADRPQLEAMSEAQLARLEPDPAALAAVAAHDTRKAAVIAALTAHTWCRLSESTLKSMTLQELEDLTAMGEQHDASYAGQGFPAVRTQADGEDAWLPKSILAKKE